MIIWAIVMIFFLPLVSRALGLPAGVAGAWIGTSEFADAAGFAAAQAYGNLAGNVPGIAGTAEQSCSAFTLMKVIGRDVWIGIWAFVMAIVATTRWETAEAGRKAEASQIWWRFPKFVSAFCSPPSSSPGWPRAIAQADFNKVVVPAFVGPG